MEGNQNLLSKMFQQQLEKNKKFLNYSEKRILKDLAELECNVDPEMGISARPLDGTIFKWHANIRGPEDTPYKGGIFHLEIDIPDTYPNKAPTFTALSGLANPFF